MRWLTREALGRVVQSLLTAELAVTRRRQSPGSADAIDASPWLDDMVLGEAGRSGPACDSLELVWLAAAANEMFCLYDTAKEESLLAAPTFGAWLDIIDAGWNLGGGRITFSTSGSTGAPKRCTHAMTDLQKEVQSLATLLPKTRRMFALTPAHHIYGFLFTALLPVHLDVPVLSAETLAPGALLRELTSGDLLVSTPPRWEWLARSIPAWPAGVRGITSTAPCPQQLKMLLVNNGLQGFTEVYGSSETGGIGTRSYPAAHYSLMPHWNWADRGDTPSLEDDAGRRVVLQDRVEIEADGSFAVLSRLDGAVQVGGVNVFPARIAAQLEALHGVAQAVVRLSSEVGRERLRAFVVPDGSLEEVVLAEALEDLSQTFPVPERIRSFTFGWQLPRNTAGKLADW